MLNFNKLKHPLGKDSLESSLFSKDSNSLKPSDYANTNLAGAGGAPPQQPPTLRQLVDKLGWRKIYLIIPPVSALIKGLLDYSNYVRRYGIYNAGQAGIAGFTEGFAYGIAADVLVESLVRGLPWLYQYGRNKNWW